MSILDIVALFIIGFFAYRGFRKGLVKSIFALLALVLAILVSMKLSLVAVAAAGMQDTQYVFLPYLAYLVLFILTLLLVNAIGSILERLLKITQLNLWNRVLGSIMGVFMACLVLSLIVWLSDQAQLLSSANARESFTYQYLHEVAPLLIGEIADLMPWFRDLFEEIETFFDEIARRLDTAD